MTKESQPSYSRCSLYLIRRLSIRIARLNIAIGMVVSQSERSAVMTQHRVQNFSDRDQRPINGPFGHGCRVSETIAGVADEDKNPFASRTV